MSDFNPYQAPDAKLDPWKAEQFHGRAAYVLATRLDRFAARFVDGLIQAIAIVPMVAGVIVAQPRGGGGQPNEVVLIAGIGLGCLLLLAIFGVNLYLLNESGQTMGKRLLKIKIADFETGATAPFGKILGLRILVMFLLEAIPFGIGGIISLVNILMIFASDQRCMHDHLAGTIVVKA